MPVLHTSDAALAAALMPSLSVEAEYGSLVVEGSVYTAAHHQPHGRYAGDHVVAGGRPAPCNDADIPAVAWDVEHGPVALVSHLDLDTVGGLLRAVEASWLECFLFHPQFAGFWNLAAFVDCYGPHKRMLSGATEEDLARLDAWWSFAQNLPRLPREGTTDVTALVMSCYSALCRVLSDDAEMLDAGRAFRAAENFLNSLSFVSLDPIHRLIVRVAPSEGAFVNHLYTSPSGALGRAIVAHNPHHGNITVSISDAIPGVSCRAIVQRLWGPLAGGHDGIAGSPRGQIMSEDDLGVAVSALRDALRQTAPQG